MLQIDHVYEFLYQEIFKDFSFLHLQNGVPKTNNVTASDISIFTHKQWPARKIFFYDQEPFIPHIAKPYMDIFCEPIDTRPGALVTSEYSKDLPENLYPLYYFFHGFAALDWYRGYYALNYNKSVLRNYKKDYISYNRLITEDRSYRIYFVSVLKNLSLLDQGLVSFNVADNSSSSWQDELNNPNCKLSFSAKEHIKTNLSDVTQLVIDNPSVHGSASANIPRTIDSWLNPDYHIPTDVTSFWHIVTETVFYYNKLHLTEKIFKPIVSKQPFMLIAAPGNLAYLKQYGFKTFNSVIDESYDNIHDNDQRIEAVVEQIRWYCSLSNERKNQVIRNLEPIVEHNFHHFYGDFKNIITSELIANIKNLYKELNADDRHIDYDMVYKLLIK